MHERDILLAVLEMADPEERETYLAQMCGANAALRSRVDALLRAAEVQDSFLEQPAIDTEVINRETDSLRQAHANCDEPSLDFLHPVEDPHALGRLGPYTITEVIGRGGMGVVLKARDSKLGRIVAIKVLAPELASNPTARKRFEREAHAAAAVVHQHVVTIHAVDEDLLPYLVMECIDGQSLQEKIDREGHLELIEVLRIGQQVAAGLAAAHAHGLMHRDVKPANILLENGVERVRITDFGLARAVDDIGMTRTGEVAGTPQYMSPEQAQGLPMDARSDLFSLGCVLYAMCTGRSPFRAETAFATARRICEDTPRPIREVNPEIPPWLVAIIDRLLAKQPQQRYQTAAEVADLLGQSLAEVQHPSLVKSAITNLPSPKSPVRIRRWSIAAAAAVVLLLAVSLGEATGVTNFAPTLLRIVTGEGTLLVEVNDPNIQVTIEGDGGLVITGAGPKEIHLQPGKYHVEATKDGQTVSRKIVEIVRGERKVVSVTQESPATGAGQVRANESHPDVGAFVVLGGKGVAERKFDTLAEAVLRASAGDTIEIRGNGPFVTDPVTIRVALRIRAADGFRPTLTLSEAGVRTASPVLEAHAPLVLEGLELQRVSSRIEESVRGDVIRSQASSLHVANCRFLLDIPSYCITSYSPQSFLRNSELITPGGHSFQYVSRLPGQFVIDNCVGSTGALVWDGAPSDSRSVQLSRNTFVGPSSLVMRFRPIVLAGEDTEPKIDFQSAGNVFGSSNLLGVEGVEPARTMATLPRRLAWQETDSVYPSQYLLIANTGSQLVQLLGGARAMDEWKRLWNLPDGQVIVGAPRFRGDIQAKLAAAPGEIAPEDFRLSAGSPGYRAGEDGQDLGANVDLVGPGAAYERWKNTPQYQQWLKDTGQFRAETPQPEPGAFVVVGGEGVAERKFDTLTEAARIARDGDTIEIRGNGPFVMDPVTISVALRIRAADGFRPTLRLSEAGARTVRPLLEAHAHLVLEGLELQRIAATRGEIVVCRGPTLHVANCRFLHDVPQSEMGGNCITSDAPNSFLTNSEFLARRGFSFQFVSRLPGQLVMKNCAGVTGVITWGGAPGDARSVQLTHNTFVGPSALSMRFLNTFLAGEHTEPSIGIQSSGNVYGGSNLLWVEGIEPARTMATLPQRLAWQEAVSLYPVQNLLCVDSGPPQSALLIQGEKALEEWRRLWTLPDSHVISGVPRFCGDIRSKLAAAPGEITPDDFRLGAGSLGYRAGKDGKDLGADVDLVGPGAAYERWKTLPEYQEWLKETGQQK
jgi:serine/threonine protein kinase